MAHRDLDRRRVLKLLAGTSVASVTALSPTALRAAQTEYDVIIVGAGMAGLTAARALHQTGYKILIIEARSRIGGRLHTDWSLGAPFEDGAGWIHGPLGNPVADLAQAGGLTTFVTDDDNLDVFTGTGENISDATLAALDEKFAAIAEAADDFDGPDLPLGKALDTFDTSLRNDPLMRWALTAFTEFDTGGPLDKLSTAYFQADTAYAGDDVIVLDGYNKVLPTMPPGVTSLLNTKVTHIEYEEGEGAAVHCDNQVFYADQVVCTLPLGVLQSGDVTFDPPLAGKTAKAIASIPMGNVTKLGLKFDAPFWDVKTQYFGFLTDPLGRWPYALNYRTFSATNILLPLCFGNYAAEVEKLNDAEMQADAMQVLRGAFGAEVPDPVALRATRWSQDPFSRGAYSYAGFGSTPDDFEAFAEPLADVLVFAGEHTNFPFHGTVHGAHFSGLRAAAQVDDLAE